MKLMYITCVLNWIILLLFDGALSSNSYTLQSRNKDSTVYVVDENNILKSHSSKFSNRDNSFSTRNKRQVQVRMGGVQHVYENPQKSYDYQNLGSSRGQEEFGSSTSSESPGSVATSDSTNVLQMLSQNPVAPVGQSASNSFSGNMVNKWRQEQRGDSAMSNLLNKYGSMPTSSQIEETNSQKTAQDIEHLRSGNLYNKEERGEEPNGQSYSPNLSVNLSPSEDRALISPSQIDEATMQGIRQEHFRSDSTLSNPPKDDSLMSLSQAKPTYIENTLQEHFHTDPPLLNPLASSSHMIEPHAIPVNPHIDNIAAHSFIHTSPIGDPNLDPPNPHVEPVVYPNSGPQVINPLGPDNLHIIKKFYPLPVVQKVPKPIPVTVTKPVPYPVHQTRFQHVPQPYPQPFSKPDVHLSHIHLENRGKLK